MDLTELLSPQLGSSKSHWDELIDYATTLAQDIAASQPTVPLADPSAVAETTMVFTLQEQASTATADDASDAGGDDEGNEPAGTANELHRGCDVLYDTGDVDIDISLFSRKLSGSFFNLGKGMFDTVKSDRVSLWKYVLRI